MSCLHYACFKPSLGSLTDLHATGAAPPDVQALLQAAGSGRASLLQGWHADTDSSKRVCIDDRSLLRSCVSPRILIAGAQGPALQQLLQLLNQGKQGVCSTEAQYSTIITSLGVPFLVDFKAAKNAVTVQSEIPWQLGRRLESRVLQLNLFVAKQLPFQ